MKLTLLPQGFDSKLPQLYVKLDEDVPDPIERYTHSITPEILKWCKSNNLRAIDLCGGHTCPNGFESADLENADIICDLNKPWPFKDGEVGVFRAADALEHLVDPLFTMREAYRCLAPNGWFLIAVPSTDGRGAFQDPTHVSFWNKNSFWYYTEPRFASSINAPTFRMIYIDNNYNRRMKEFGVEYVETHLLKYQEGAPSLFS